MKAVDIMSTKVVTIDSWATIAEAAKMMKQHQVRTLIVDRTSERDPYGIITATDISQAIALAQNPKKTYVKDIMTQPCIVVNPNLAVEHIAKLFTRAKIRVAPVIQDKLLGIISLTDILTKTNFLDSSKNHSTLQKIAESAEPPFAEFPDYDWETESDSIYENWCSG